LIFADLFSHLIDCAYFNTHKDSEVERLSSAVIGGVKSAPRGGISVAAGSPLVQGATPVRPLRLDKNDQPFSGTR
jgi:hypothetical protein